MGTPFIRDPQRGPPAAADRRQPWDEGYDAWLVCAVLFLFVLLLSILRVSH